MNIILTSGRVEEPLDDKHQFVSIGQNCWGKGRTAAEAYANAKKNAWTGRGAKKFIITRVCPIDGFNVDTVDGAVGWNAAHDANNCKFCTVGKGIRINVE